MNLTLVRLEDAMDTKEKILYNALDMFARSGYNAVSVRDIAGSVNIKESSIYYHFKNKQDILDSIVKKFEEHISGLTDILNTAVSGTDLSKPFSFDAMRTYFFEQYLFDPFCNKMIRFMMIEQFSDEKMQSLYEHYLFELPERIQTGTFLLMSRNGLMSAQQAGQIGQAFFSRMTTLTFRYLLNGDLTEDKKRLFCEKAFSFFDDVLRGVAEHG